MDITVTAHEIDTCLEAFNQSRPTRDDAGRWRMREAITALKRLNSTAKPSFQKRVVDWAIACFGERYKFDPLERRHRFLEEALELVQALGYSVDDAYDMVDYVFSRPPGEPHQEVGGTMMALAALCEIHGLDMTSGGEDELARVWTKIDAIRAKAAAKAANTALPGGAGKPRSQRIKELEAEVRRLRDDVVTMCMGNRLGRSREVEVIHDEIKRLKGLMERNGFDELIFGDGVVGE